MEIPQELLIEEAKILRSKNSSSYLECLNNKPLSKRKTDVEIRDGLILYWHVWMVISKNIA